MNKEITITAMNTDNGIAGEYHSKTLFELSNKNTFNTEDLFDSVILIQTPDTPIVIDRAMFVLDFDRPNKQFYCRTKTYFSDGVEETESPFSPISIITSNGSNNIYNHSDVIIKTPRVELVVKNGLGTNDLSFTSEPIFLYSGTGNLTHVSYRLLDEKEVIWERLKDPAANLTIDLPMKLEEGKSYTFEVSHHVGDSMSQWGKCYFRTNTEHSELFEVMFERDKYGSYNVLDIENNNHLLLLSIRKDVTDLKWNISQNGVDVVTSDTVPVDPLMPVRNNGLIIPGSFLMENEKYELNIELKYNKITSRNSYSVIALAGYDYSNKVDSEKRTMNLVNLGDPLVEAQRTTYIMDTKPRFGKVIDVAYGIVNRNVRKVFRVGSEIKKIPMASPIQLDDLMLDKESKVTIIDNRAIVMYVREFAYGGQMYVKRTMKIYDYNPILKEIYNVNNHRRLDIDLSVTLEENMDVLHVGFNLVSVLAYNDLTGDYELKTINISTGMFIDGETKIVGNVSELGATKRPHLGKVNKDYLLILGELKTLLYDRRLKNVVEINQVQSTNITLTEWTSLNNTSNGELILSGVNANVSENELCSVLSFNIDSLMFELQHTGLLPKMNGLPDLRKPNVVIVDKGSMGLLFDEKSLWLL